MATGILLGTLEGVALSHRVGVSPPDPRTERDPVPETSRVRNPMHKSILSIYLIIPAALVPVNYSASNRNE
jgi:hypothetical protein